MKAPPLPALRIILSIFTIVLLAALIYHADVGALSHSLSNISLHTIIIGLALVQLQIILSALRWRFTAARLGQEISTGKAISEYYVASFLNQTLPGGVSGDVVRAWRARGNGAGAWKQPAKAVALERLSGQLALFTLAASGLVLWPFVHDSPQAIDFLVPVLAVMAAMIVLSRRRKHPALSSLLNELSEVFFRRGAWLFQSMTSIAILLGYISVFFIAAQATGSQLPWIAVITIIPFCLVAMLVPTGFGGWGTREAAAMAMWPLLGGSSEQGLAASIAYGALSLAGAAPGIIILTISALSGKPGRS